MKKSTTDGDNTPEIIWPETVSAATGGIKSKAVGGTRSGDASKGAVTAPKLQLGETLQAAADRWEDWTLPTRDVTVEHVARWGREVRASAADLLLRWLRFGEVYESLPNDKKASYRDAFDYGKSWACDAARAYRFVIEQHDGSVPEEVGRPTELVALERDHRRQASRSAPKEMEQTEADAAQEQDEEGGTAEPSAELQSLAGHLEGCFRLLSEIADPVPEELIVQFRKLLTLMEGRVQASDAAPPRTQARASKRAPKAVEASDDEDSILEMFGFK